MSQQAAGLGPDCPGRWTVHATLTQCVHHGDSCSALVGEREPGAPRKEVLEEGGSRRDVKEERVFLGRSPELERGVGDPQV